MDDGFAEALVRGLRSTFLSDGEYANLKEGGARGGRAGAGGREDFEDLKLTLQETDYGNFLSNEPALDPKIIASRMTAKWVREFNYVRVTSTGALSRFLDFVKAEYVIDNILDLVKAATSAQSVDMEAVVANCHPLGMLEPSTMKSILAYEDLSEDFHALYRTVLVDTPVGKYFTAFIQEQVDERAAMDPDAVKGLFAEMPMTLIENSVKKLYLEDFHRFCVEELGGETGEIMDEVLSLRADQMTINIAYNSLTTDLTGAAGRGGAGAAGGAGAGAASRARLFPAFGRLYPGGSELLARVEDEDALRRAIVKAWPAYGPLWDAAPTDSRGVKDVSHSFFRATVRALELAFDSQFHYAVFYAFAKLKEQEVKNVAWIATCLEHGVYAEMDRVIVPLSKAAAGKAGAAGGH